MESEKNHDEKHEKNHDEKHEKNHDETHHKAEHEKHHEFHQESKKSDSVEIPLGKMASSVKKNPWMLISLILVIVLVGVIVSGNGGGSGIEGTISAQEAGENVISFINSNPQLEGEVTLVSSVRQGPLYQVILNFQGSDVPLYTTLDGEYLVSDIIPISGDALAGAGGGSSGIGEALVPLDVSLDDDAVLGNADAPVTIVEFSDYQCPFCQLFWEDTFPLIKSEYIETGLVKFVYRDFPLSDIHPEAQKAAEAAECVRELGGDGDYFEYHDVLFGNQADLSSENYVKWASEMGHDIEECLESGKFAIEVTADLAEGSSYGVTGTPGFFVNGLRIDGAQPFSVFKQVIDAQLEVAGAEVL